MNFQIADLARKTVGGYIISADRPDTKITILENKTYTLGNDKSGDGTAIEQTHLNKTRNRTTERIENIFLMVQLGLSAFYKIQ